MEEVKALIELAKLSLNRYDERRKYHWRISFAFWALIIGGIIKRKELALSLPHQTWILIIASVLYLFLWLRSVWVADENDKRLSQHFKDEAFSKLQDANYKITPPPDKISITSLIFWFGFLKDWTTLSHILVTLTLIAFLYSLSSF